MQMTQMNNSYPIAISTNKIQQIYTKFNLSNIKDFFFKKKKEKKSQSLKVATALSPYLQMNQSKEYTDQNFHSQLQHSPKISSKLNFETNS